MLKKIIAIAGVAGTLGVAAPAFADWHGGYGGGYRGGVVARPIYRPVARPYYGYGYNNGYNAGYTGDYDGDDDGYAYRPEYRRGWAWHRHEWRRHHGYRW